MSESSSSTPSAPSRVFVMHRSAWWRLSAEEWWSFVSDQLRAGDAAFPHEAVLGQPRAVRRTEDEDGNRRYEAADDNVWVEVIDQWTDDDWARAADQLIAVGMSDPRAGGEPWPSGVRHSRPTPVYGIEAYGGGERRARPRGRERREETEGDSPQE